MIVRICIMIVSIHTRINNKLNKMNENIDKGLKDDINKVSQLCIEMNTLQSVTISALSSRLDSIGVKAKNEK